MQLRSSDSRSRRPASCLYLCLAVFAVSAILIYSAHHAALSTSPFSKTSAKGSKPTPPTKARPHGIPAWATSNSPQSHNSITPAIAHELASHAISTPTINPLLFIIPVNMGMLHWARNLRCSLARIGATDTLSHLIFWALDSDAADAMRAENLNVYHDPSLYSISTNENAHGVSEQYKKMMRERPKFFMDMLDLGYDLLFSDADIVYYQDPVTALVPSNDTEMPDMVFSTDARGLFMDMEDPFQDPWSKGDLVPPVCNGFFWMRGSDTNHDVWGDVQAVFNHTFSRWMEPWWEPNDQEGMDFVLNDGHTRLVAPFPRGIEESMIGERYKEQNITRTIRLLDQIDLANGHLLVHWQSRYEEEVKKSEEAGRPRVGVHMNWWAKETSKEEGSRTFGLWFLDDDGKCVL